MTLRDCLNQYLQKISYRLVKLPKNRVRGLVLEHDLGIIFRDFKVTPVEAVLFDIGTNEGQTLRRFAQIMPDAEIHGFEPTGELFEKLTHNYPSTTHPRIHLNRLALGDCIGKGVLHLASNSEENSLLATKTQEGSMLGEATVEISTLDHYCAQHKVERIDLLKIDAEGYDYKVLLGGAAILDAKIVKLILVECHFPARYEGEASFENIHHYLEDKGYQFVDFYDKVYKHNALNSCNALFRIPEAAG